ncbi:MAG: carboxypeptidase-like regulatory domain-containing protein, partial [Prevotella sp.]
MKKLLLIMALLAPLAIEANSSVSAANKAIAEASVAYDDDDDEDRLTVSGSVRDADLKEPVMQASVQLFRQKDSTFVGGSITDLRGNFSVEAPANGIYRLKISSVGFQPIEREVTLRRNQSQDLGLLLMVADAVLIKETVVTGRAAQVIVKKDTLVYNPDAFRTPEGSPIEELIKRMPGAEVDEDGNITVNGKAVQKILLDGKEFMLGDVETALKNL